MKKMSKILIVLFLAFAVLFAAACAQEAPPAPQPEAPAPQAPGEPADEDDPVDEPPAVTGGEIVWVQPSDPPSLDPLLGTNDAQTNEATAQMFERLTYYRDDLTIGPLLATSWERLDPYVWEFTLRQGVYFHDDSPFTAEAVKLSLEWLLDEENASPRANILDMIVDIEVIDDFTIQLTTEMPFGPLAAHLAHGAGSVASVASLEEARAGGRSIDENPVGTGPFIFDSRESGDHVRWVRNDNYWGSVPYVDSLVFRTVPEPATRVAMIEAGEAHGGRFDPRSAALAQAVPHLDFFSVQSTSLDYIGFNLQRPPLDNIDVRRAISMAINKSDILMLIEGNGIEAVAAVAPNVWGAPPSAQLNTIDFDPDGARALLEEAGFGDGFALNIWYNDGNLLRQGIAELVQHNLAQVGITVSIESVEWGAYLARTGAGEHDMFILGWTTLTADADYGLFPVFHSSLLGEPGNRTFLEDAEVDRLLEEARGSVDEAERLALYAELIQLLIDLAPTVNLYHQKFIAALNGISGYRHDFNGVPDFRNATVA